MNTLRNNAYHVLGLDTSASEKEILKRSKEIINRLKIDDHPEYDLDTGAYSNFRTEDSVREALRRLQAPRTRIREYFFWFQVADSLDEQALGAKKLSDAIRIWENAARGESAKAQLYRRNLAILYCIALSAENDHRRLHDSLAAWKAIVDSEKFWSSFAKMYKLHNDQTASDEIINDFRKHAVSYLSDLYTELYELHHDSEYIRQFQKAFSTRGEKVEKTILNPVYKNINDVIERLELLRISEDGKFDETESTEVKLAVGALQSELNKIVDLGLYDDSQTKIMRDRAANALRGIVLDVHNNLNDLEKSHKLLGVAIRIAGTESLKKKLEWELQQINENVKAEKEDFVTIDVPGKASAVVFRRNCIEYNNQRILYEDCVRMSYHSVSQSVNLIPISQTFSFMVASEKDEISVSFGTSLNIGKAARLDAWAKIASIASHTIEPVIVRKLVGKIFDQHEPVMMGGIEFSEEGYSRQKFFGGKETIHWTDAHFTPEFDSGNVILWKDAGAQFSTVAMSSPNAVVIPELVKACINRAQEGA